MRTIDLFTLLSPHETWRLIRGIIKAPFDSNFAGYPLAVCWFTNFSCNANCHFCCKAAEIKSGKNRFPPLTLDKAKELMEKVRKTVDMLYLSGGEVTIHPHIIDILKEAKRLKFRVVGMSSNLIALDKKPEILEYLKAISVSIHSPDVKVHARNLGVSTQVAKKVFRNLEMVRNYAGQNNIKIMVNRVINSTNIHTVMDMVDFAGRNGCLLELVPANDHGRIPKDLYHNPDYIALIDKLLDLRKSGKAPHLAGSTYYYKLIRDFRTFRCFPYGVPNITPDGRLCTPCDVSEQYAVNVLNYRNLKEALRASIPFLGKYPCKQGECFKAPIVERSRLFGLLSAGKKTGMNELT